MEKEQIDVAFKGPIGDFNLDIEFPIPLRGITALFGPSGCGKTTILRCLAGLHHMPGKVIAGKEIWQNDKIFLKPHKRSVGYIFQEANLFSHLTVRQNLLYGAERARVHNLKETFHYNDVVELLGINHLLNRSTLSLSGGERQRVAIGRAILAQPRLLLMDEPLSALDHISKQGILSCFQRLHHEFSLPILYVSHDIREVSLLSDRIIVLANGKKVKEGTTKEIVPSLNHFNSSNFFNEPEGEINIITTIKEHDSNYHVTILDILGQQIIVPIINEKPGTEVHISFISDDITIFPQIPDIRSSANILTANVENIEINPEAYLINISIKLGDKVIKKKIPRKKLDELSLETDSPIFLSLGNISYDT